MAPKYVKYPCAPLVPYSWLPGAGFVSAFRRPYDASYTDSKLASAPFSYCRSPSARNHATDGSARMRSDTACWWHVVDVGAPGGAHTRSPAAATVTPAGGGVVVGAASAVGAGPVAGVAMVGPAPAWRGAGGGGGVVVGAAGGGGGVLVRVVAGGGPAPGGGAGWWEPPPWCATTPVVTATSASSAATPPAAAHRARACPPPSCPAIRCGN